LLCWEWKQQFWNWKQNNRPIWKKREWADCDSFHLLNPKP
jgi:hypothetical protein